LPERAVNIGSSGTCDYGLAHPAALIERVGVAGDRATPSPLAAYQTHCKLLSTRRGLARL
jgi:hypothetical protein